MMKESSHHKSDGQLETLDDLSKAVNYNKWIFRLIEPHLGNRVLEVGCGTGNIIEHLKERNVLGVDINPYYLRVARDKFKNRRNVSFRRIDLSKGLKIFKNFKPDTIVCINVLEHIKNDQKFIAECKSLLAPGGKLILFVPAIPSIFGEMDKTYGHFRRYTKPEILEKAKKGKLNVVLCDYLNISGIFGWWLNGKVFKRKIIPQSQILLYDKIFNFVFLLENFIPKFLGLSIFIVCQKSK